MLGHCNGDRNSGRWAAAPAFAGCKVHCFSARMCCSGTGPLHLHVLDVHARLFLIEHGAAHRYHLCTASLARARDMRLPGLCLGAHEWFAAGSNAPCRPCLPCCRPATSVQHRYPAQPTPHSSDALQLKRASPRACRCSTAPCAGQGGLAICSGPRCCVTSRCAADTLRRLFCLRGWLWIVSPQLLDGLRLLIS